jgi:urease accessory protein
MDMADAASVVVGLASVADRLGGHAAAAAARPLSGGPAWSAPALELRAEEHARWEVRLFAS